MVLETLLLNKKRCVYFDIKLVSNSGPSGRVLFISCQTILSITSRYLQKIEGLHG